MSGLSFPNDELNQKSDPSIQNGRGSDLFLHPIDESDEFFDPFSDLSLFLSKKIKGEIEEMGSSKSWSGKIEAKLLAKILPEFREKFPKYRLGVNALKKVWEKVSYYYEKIQGDKEAVKPNGTLNLKFMIQENLKKLSLPHHIPPFTASQQIAHKLSECIATLEGKKPKVDYLTRIIWAVQKHLLKDFSILRTKSPYDVYDEMDKLIVKAQLEITAKGQNLDPTLLKREIFRTLQTYNEIKTLRETSQLTSTLSMILAEKLYSTSLINCHFSLKEQKEIEAFIRHHIEMGKFNAFLAKDEHRLEIIQRVLALYTIADGLPKNLSEDKLRYYIGLVQTGEGKPGEIDPALYVFLSAEMHLMDEKKSLSPSSIDAIISSYKQALHLPSLNAFQLEQFELLTWKMIEEEGNLLSHIPTEILSLLEREVGHIVIDHPKQSFRLLISHALQFFKKVMQQDFEEEKLSEKIDIWVAQNDMLIRNIHFDPNSPLLKLLEHTWRGSPRKKEALDHERFVEEVKEKALASFPLLYPFEEELVKRLWILYKYHWYHALTDETSSSYERFLAWHRVLLQRRHPDWPKDRLSETLKTLSDQLLPFVPFSDAG
ncbi:MAG: hypothetical protein KDK60_03020 [Chlamydiia bacterium]|nr:hypothetical protein [Chlamydiia bacterium]